MSVDAQIAPATVWAGARGDSQCLGACAGHAVLAHDDRDTASPIGSCEWHRPRRRHTRGVCRGQCRPCAPLCQAPPRPLASGAVARAAVGGCKGLGAVEVGVGCGASGAGGIVGARCGVRRHIWRRHIVRWALDAIARGTCASRAHETCGRHASDCELL